MKRWTVLFLCTVFLGLMVAPVVNLLRAVERGEELRLDKKSLYNLDFLSRLANRALYPLGISLPPTKAVIGYDDWLFLTATLDRPENSTQNTAEDEALNHEISGAHQAWQSWLTDRGVKGFFAMLGPDKATIYPEHLPHWSRDKGESKTDKLMSAFKVGSFLDLRGPLWSAKATTSFPLYFKTDTHWNALGAGLAFQALSNQVAATLPSLSWPEPNAFLVRKTGPMPDGDLARFLRLEGLLEDTNLSITGARRGTKTQRYDFDTGEIEHQGGNPKVRVRDTPIRVRSSNALNDMKVLWVRDSFGNILAPLMAATFSDVLHIHHRQAFGGEQRLAELVQRYQPDLVFLTVVERDSRLPYFALRPPAD